MRNTNRYMDFDGSGRLNNLSNQYSGRSNLIYQIIAAFLGFVFGGLAVAYRLFFRKRIGGLTLTPLSIIMAALWTFAIFALPSDFTDGDVSPFVPDFTFNGRYAVGMALGLFFLIKGFAIIWWIVPRALRKGIRHNPLSLGLAYIHIGQIDEYEPQEWNGKTKAPLFYERKAGPTMIFIAGFVLGGAGIFAGIDPPYNGLLFNWGLFLTLTSIAAFFEAWGLEQQFFKGRMAQLANEAHHRHIVSKFEYQQKTDTAQTEGQTVYYNGQPFN